MARDPLSPDYGRLAGASRRRDLPTPRAACHRRLRDGPRQRPSRSRSTCPTCTARRALVLVERPISESIVRTPVSGELESRLYVIKQEILSRDRLIELIERFNLYPELRQRRPVSRTC